MIGINFSGLTEIDLEQTIRKELRFTTLICEEFILETVELYKPVDSLTNLFYNDGLINSNIFRPIDYYYPETNSETVDLLISTCLEKSDCFFTIDFLLPGIVGNKQKSGMKALSINPQSRLANQHNQIARKILINHFLSDNT